MPLSFPRGGYLAGRLLEFDLICSVLVVFLSEKCSTFRSFLQSIQHGGPRYRVVDIYVKTVLLILFKGFPNRFSSAGFFPSRIHCPILYGEFVEIEIDTFKYWVCRFTLATRYDVIGICRLTWQSLWSCLEPDVSRTK